MKIAIHHRPGSFSDRWIAYCEKQGIPYKLVHAFDSDIVEQLSDCDAFMWHHHHAVSKDVVAAKKILFALEHAGIKVFPDFKTGWHFDDKVAQKYLLEAIGAPLVPSYVFYNKHEALEWINNTKFPKVFKLKGGAGSTNVRLVNNKREAKKIVSRAFGKGVSHNNLISIMKESFRKYRRRDLNYKGLFSALLTAFKAKLFYRFDARDIGYVYFQDFMPNNKFDVRVLVSGGLKAAGFKRYVRKGDFRASGSGEIDYFDIDEHIVKISFSVSRKLGLESVAFDFVYNEAGEPMIVEMSYGYALDLIEKAPGYWDSELVWHDGQFQPQDEIMKSLLEKVAEAIR